MIRTVESLAMVLGLSTLAGAAAGERVTAIPHVRVFVGDAPEHVLEDATVVLRGARIDVVGPAGEVPIPAEARVVEGRGRTLMPGLADLHVHLEGSALPFDLPVAGDPELNARAALASGVTTLLDLNGRETALLSLRAREREGGAGLPRVFLAGLAITAPGGHGTEGGFPGRTAADARAAVLQVEDLARIAPDVVKLVFDGGRWGDFASFPTFGEEALAAAIAAAHERKLKVVVHAVDAGLARVAIELGADALAHLPFFGEVDDSWIERARARGVFVIPTLAVAAATFRSADQADWFDVPLVGECVDPRIPLAFSDPARRERLSASESAAFFRSRHASARARLKRLADAGIPLLAGSDAGSPAVCFGEALHRELEEWVAAGIAPAAALVAATSAPAAFLGRGDSLGTIASGRIADLVLVEGNPTRRIEDLRNVVDVFVGGEPIERGAITHRLAERARRQPIGVPDPDALSVLAFDAPDGALPKYELATDRPGGGGSQIEALAVRDYGDENQSGFLRLRGTIVVKPPDGGFAAVVFPVAAETAPGLRSIRFRVRSDRARPVAVIVRTSDVLDQDWFRAPVDASARWVEFEVPVPRLAQVGFGHRVEFDPSHVVAVELRIGGDGGTGAGPFVLDIDDLLLRK